LPGERTAVAKASRCGSFFQEESLALRRDRQLPAAMSQAMGGILLAEANEFKRSWRAPNL